MHSGWHVSILSLHVSPQAVKMQDTGQVSGHVAAQVFRQVLGQVPPQDKVGHSTCSVGSH
ncbi:MAG: hypothetical protein PVH88_07595 [Ignavibacteria bacterium]